MKKLKFFQKKINPTILSFILSEFPICLQSPNDSMVHISACNIDASDKLQCIIFPSETENFIPIQFLYSFVRLAKNKLNFG